MVESTLVFFLFSGSMESVWTEEAVLLERVSETRELPLEPSLVDLDRVRSETVELLSAVRSCGSIVLVLSFSSDVLELLVLSVLGVTVGIVESTVDVFSLTVLTPASLVSLVFVLNVDGSG